MEAKKTGAKGIKKSAAAIKALDWKPLYDLGKGLSGRVKMLRTTLTA